MKDYKKYFENERIAKLLSGDTVRYDFYSDTSLSRYFKAYCGDCDFLGIGTIYSVNGLIQCNDNGKEPTRIHSFWRLKASVDDSDKNKKLLNVIDNIKKMLGFQYDTEFIKFMGISAMTLYRLRNETKLRKSRVYPLLELCLKSLPEDKIKKIMGALKEEKNE